ncbi:DUF5684 domain-containing protein [Mucilaginibacter sp. FT3.2]|uniref:DUF5684 domain-containing protein n=1 Tax=Mucilaginibacter sp. FT3.2 TaxID=2723090 RepID=UPI0016225052|nr:DUF5684 domain-containing protein [Mucilaginibacter sp. FT3.2]MBB6234477.1 hypothetical protein [Mucilaginibacter sp. FT3.2]
MENYPNSAFNGAFKGVLIVELLVLLLCAVAAWKVFTKAGKPGWAAIIPIYNYIVLCEIVGKPVWWFLLMICPCINFIFLIWVCNLLSKSFGKSEGFTVGMVLLHPIFIMILGFGDSVYLGPSAKEANMFNRFGSGDYQKPFDPQP